jgi:hypothetical protein
MQHMAGLFNAVAPEGHGLSLIWCPATARGSQYRVVCLILGAVNKVTELTLVR